MFCVYQPSTHNGNKVRRMSAWRPWSLGVESFQDTTDLGHGPKLAYRQGQLFSRPLMQLWRFRPILGSCDSLLGGKKPEGQCVSTGFCPVLFLAKEPRMVAFENAREEGESSYCISRRKRLCRKLAMVYWNWMSGKDHVLSRPLPLTDSKNLLSKAKDGPCQRDGRLSVVQRERR